MRSFPSRGLANRLGGLAWETSEEASWPLGVGTDGFPDRAWPHARLTAALPAAGLPTGGALRALTRPVAGYGSGVGMADRRTARRAVRGRLVPPALRCGHRPG